MYYLLKVQVKKGLADFPSVLIYLKQKTARTKCPSVDIDQTLSLWPGLAIDKAWYVGIIVALVPFLLIRARTLVVAGKQYLFQALLFPLDSTVFTIITGRTIILAVLIIVGIACMSFSDSFLVDYLHFCVVIDLLYR